VQGKYRALTLAYFVIESL